MKNKVSIIFLVLLAGRAFAADFTVPRFEMATLGANTNGQFNLKSSVSADLSVTGGYKYGIALGFSFDSTDLTAGSGSLNFRMVKATARELLGLPLEMSFFVGQGDDFCSGDEFSTRFGYEPIGTAFNGLFYFPDGIGGDFARRYHGVYGVRGTGLSFALTSADSFVPILYVYQAEGNAWSGDLRFLMDMDSFKLEAFGGLSFADNTIIRGGVLAHFNTGGDIEFLFQGGLSGWKVDSDLTVDNFYFLMEPRFRLGVFGLTGTFFYHPVMYNNILTEAERGMVDVNLKFFTEIPDTVFSVGIESGMNLKIDKIEDLALGITPFVSFVSDGFRWDAKLRFSLVDFDSPAEIFNFFIGVTSSF